MRCDGCGANLDVPRLGTLVRLEPAATEPIPRAAAWTASKACLILGLVVLVVAAAAAGWLRGRRSAVAPLAEDAIRAAVSAADVAQVHASWLEYERQGIHRPPVAEEERRQRQAGGLAALERMAWFVAVLGGLTAAIAAVRVGLAPRN